MEIEAWAEGAQAYRDYCSLESDNFEAWNNLARCYIKTKQKERAWRVLQEAVRYFFYNYILLLHFSYMQNTSAITSCLPLYYFFSFLIKKYVLIFF